MTASAPNSMDTFLSDLDDPFASVDGVFPTPVTIDSDDDDKSTAAYSRGAST